MIHLPGDEIDPLVAQLLIAVQAQKLTQKQMTRRDGIPPETWRSWIYGERSPTVNKLRLRANTIGYDLFLGKIFERPHHEHER